MTDRTAGERSGARRGPKMAWRVTSDVELVDALDDRIRDLELALVIGHASGRPQWTGPRNEHVKWQIIDATFHKRMPWELN